jgi:(p)ppGpp synthase/HD superfamily hydrolase
VSGSLTAADQRAIADATAAALAWHGGQRRKGADIAYASHLVQVAGLVLEHGGSAAAAVAALLHDAVEDTDATLEEVAARFGDHVASIVAECTDTSRGDDPGHKRPWADRKAAFLAALPAVSDDAALVIACDKVHNLRTMVAEVDAGGPDAIAPPRFSVTPHRQLQYHEAVHATLAGRIPLSLHAELGVLLARLRVRIVPD